MDAGVIQDAEEEDSDDSLSVSVSAAETDDCAKAVETKKYRAVDEGVVGGGAGLEYIRREIEEKLDGSEGERGPRRDADTVTG